LEGLQKLFLVEALHALFDTVVGRDLEVVRERVVRRLESVAELVALEDVVVRPRDRNDAVLRVDRASDCPERALPALDPDHDLLARAVLPDSVEDPLSEASARWLERHRCQDTIAPCPRLGSRSRRRAGSSHASSAGGATPTSTGRSRRWTRSRRTSSASTGR